MKELLHDVSYIAIDTDSQHVERSEINQDFQSMHVVSVAGGLVAPDDYLQLKHLDFVPKDTALADVIDAQGEWSALATSRKEGMNHFLYFGDSSGFAPLFYSLLPGKAVVISDSFSGVVHGVRELGGKLSLNLPNYVTLLSGTSTLFQNLIVDETMAREIHLLRHNEALYIGPESASIIDRTALSHASQVDDYGSALNKGIETAATSIGTFARANAHHNPIITLTGGVDSRLILALLSTTDIASEFKIWSMDPRNARRPQQRKVLTADVEIANELRNKFKLKWMSPRFRSKISLSFDEALAHYQSFNSNFSYRFTPANHITVDEHPLLTLRGGGGEILRGTGSARIMASRYLSDEQRTESSRHVEWAAKFHLSRSLLSGPTRDIAEQYLIEIFSSYPKFSLRESADAHYRDTRNRGHFGHMRQSDALNDRLFQVLSNPFLVRAAELIGYQETISGRVVADIFDAIDPSLRRIPFESTGANKQLLQGDVNDFVFKDRHAWQGDFDELKKRAKPTSFKPLFYPGDRNEEWDFNPLQSLTNHIHNGFDAILELASDEDRQILIPLHELILRAVSENEIPLGSTSAKIASTLEMVNPLPLTTPGLHLYSDPSRHGRIPPSYTLLGGSRMEPTTLPQDS